MSRPVSTIAAFLILAAPAMVLAADAARSASTQSGQQKPIYTCPMHPQIQWTRPDKCPICEMKLVAKGGAEQGVSEPAGMQMDHQDMQPGHGGTGSMMMGCGSMCMEMMGMGGMNGHAMQAAPAGASAKPMTRSYQTRRSSRGCGC